MGCTVASSCPGKRLIDVAAHILRQSHLEPPLNGLWVTFALMEANKPPSASIASYPYVSVKQEQLRIGERPWSPRPGTLWAEQEA